MKPLTKAGIDPEFEVGKRSGGLPEILVSQSQPTEWLNAGEDQSGEKAEGGVPYLTSLILFRIDFSSVRVVSSITEIGITGLPIALRADNLVCNSSTETMSLLLKKIYSVFSASLAL